MFKLLIGPALAGGGYLAGSIYGADTEQLVHKSPSVTYAAVEQALGNIRQSGSTFFEGGTPVAYELKVDHTLDQRLVVTLYFAGQQGAQADLTFTPQNDGKDTLITGRIHGDHSVLRTALAGTSKARLAYAPDWMLNLTARPLLRQLAGQIEQGQAVGDPIHGFQSEADWEGSLPPDKQRQMQEWRQYDASRPMTDPDADAKRFMNGAN
jgi:hypothetical protein